MHDTATPVRHRGAGPRYSPRTPARPVALVARGEGFARYAVGPRVNFRRALGALVALVATLAVLAVLGAAGRSDLQRHCDEAWHWNAYGTTLADDRMTCSQTFPGRYPATDHLG